MKNDVYEMQKTKEYKEMRYTGICSFAEAEKKLGRELTEAEEWAVWDNKQCQVLVDMGR